VGFGKGSMTVGLCVEDTTRSPHLVHFGGVVDLWWVVQTSKDMLIANYIEAFSRFAVGQRKVRSIVLAKGKVKKKGAKKQ